LFLPANALRLARKAVTYEAVVAGTVIPAWRVFMIAGSQCRAARALVEITRGKLSERSGVDESVIRDFERKLGKPDGPAIRALQDALPALGAVFIEENGGGIGVRLKFTAAEARQIARLEGEGGLVASDDVP
jgi:hypothetical protein